MEKKEKDHFNQHILSFILKTLDKCQMNFNLHVALNKNNYKLLFCNFG